MSDEIALLEKALEASPDNWIVRRSLAAKLFEGNRASDAGKLIREAPEIPSTDKDQLFAAELLVMHDTEAAHERRDKCR